MMKVNKIILQEPTQYCSGILRRPLDELDVISIGRVHLVAPIDDVTACGLAIDEYDYVETDKRVDCESCRKFIEWAKKVAKEK